MNASINNPYLVEARYVEQRIPHFRDNPLICALPRAPSDEELMENLFDLPQFSMEQRDWPTSDRLHMVSQLSRFLSPLERHIQLARAFDMFIRNGYVDRAPRSAEHVHVYQQLYEAKQQGRAFLSDFSRPEEAQLSAAVIGWSGIGKTTTIRRIFSQYPQAIHHPKFGITQVPYIHIECPHDGISVKGLAASIIRKLDQLVPDVDYYDLYLKRSGTGETLLNHAARVMHNHFVGVLVVDEIHNLKNAGRNKTTLMAALVTASNELKVPIVFVGTNKAVKVLGIDFSSGRRSSAAGFPMWTALKQSGDLEKPGEWEDFLASLWPFQWIQHPVELNQYLANYMFDCSQGIPDIAIKLFACAQWRAMLDGTESFSVNTLAEVMKSELVRVAPMLDAIREDDVDALNEFEDIAPLHISSLLDDALNSYEGVRQRGAEIKPGHVSFVPRVSGVLVEAGIDEVRAVSMAQKVANEGKVTGVVDGATAALKLARPPRAARKKVSETPDELVQLAPDDYRNAIRAAKRDGTTIFSHLRAMGAARPLDDILDLI
ncbi:AAA family ATPase [Paraburkholderia sediminicola]|uniref:AAA family ATPase n=1 Tax=Paraburkholderia sediminicola TaxID=458836 RepID=UPI0038BA9445